MFLVKLDFYDDSVDSVMEKTIGLFDNLDVANAEVSELVKEENFTEFLAKFGIEYYDAMYITISEMSMGFSETKFREGYGKGEDEWVHRCSVDENNNKFIYER